MSLRRNEALKTANWPWAGMNYLAHVALAGRSDEALLGNLLGDFVKGLDVDRLSETVRCGIRVHHAVDRFTDRDATVVRARQRIDPRYGHMRRVLLDVFFDHYLTRHWSRFFPDSPLEALTRRVYRVLRAHEPLLPDRLARMRPRMEAEDWLASYGEVEQIDRVLAAMERRLRRPRLLADGGRELRARYDRLEADFLEFFPRLREFARERECADA